MDYKELLKDKVVRIKAMENNFPLFFCYHFGRPLTKFQLERANSMQSSNNTFIEGFRASRKTTIAKGFIVWCICYKKRDYILRQSYEEPDSRNNVTDIAKMLFAPTIVEDYGKLFPTDTKVEDFSKKTQGNFDTTNKVRVQAKGLMQSTRGLNTYDGSKGQTERPDLLCQPKGNAVITAQGEKDVSEICVGDYVYTHKGRYRKVIKNWNTKELDIYKVKIHGYNEWFSFSEGHKIYSKNYRGDFQRRYDKLYPATFNEVGELKRGAYIGYPINYKEEQYKFTIHKNVIVSNKINEKGQFTEGAKYEKIMNDVKLSKDDYYILGQFFGDGSVSKNGVIIYCDKNKPDIINKIKEKSRFNVNETIRGGVNRLTLSSVELERICRQIKIKGKNSWKLMPYGFETDLIENQIEFIKGYIDSDGYVDKKNNCIRITSVNLSGLRQVQRVLLRMNITSYIRDGIDGKDDYVIYGYKCKTQKKYDLYMRNGIEILGYGLKSQERYKYDNLPVHISDGYLWSSIKEINKEGKEKCYSFVVDEDHSYCNHLVGNHNCLDDVDVVKSVMNPTIINQNERKLLGELFGALDPLDHKIIFLGNTILEDGIVPRLRRLYENNDKWDVFRQPLFVDGKNVRPEVFTEEVIEDAKGNGKIAYQQNYLLIPASSGSGIFVREYFDYFLTSHFEMVESPLKKSDIRRGMFIDPAFSSSDKSDDAVVIILGEHRISKQYYLLDGYGGTSAPSTTRSNIVSMYYKATLSDYPIEFIHCEDVKINKDQTQFIKDLRLELLENKITCPLYTSTPQTAKNQRIKDILEPVFSMKGMKFNRGLDSEFIQKLERQLLDHPNSDKDDHSDCLAQGVGYFRRVPESKNNIEKPPVYNTITGEMQRTNDYSKNPYINNGQKSLYTKQM